MAIESTVEPYEVLIRLNPDGTVKGAHHQRLQKLTDDTVILSASLLPPIPLTLPAELNTALEAFIAGLPE